MKINRIKKCVLVRVVDWLMRPFSYCGKCSLKIDNSLSISVICLPQYFTNDYPTNILLYISGLVYTKTL